MRTVGHMSLAVTILGCGSSGGVPRVGSGWGACDPANPRNRRRRCSILIERRSADGITRALVDTSPDLREQLLSEAVTSIDGVVFTHAHADHTHGIDDLRPLVIHMRRRVEAFMDEETAASLRQRFDYCFVTPPGSEYPPLARERRIVAGHGFSVDGAGGPLEIMPLRLLHGPSEALGLRFGDVAYTPDVSDIPAEAEERLAGLDLWIIDALRPTPHPSHFSLSDALRWIERLKPRRAVLTNLHTDLDYATLKRELPPGVEPAFDGKRLTSDLPVVP
jgi:phosphoribosyl 1,2-cyclic phosphate phosphodiesterase